MVINNIIIKSKVSIYSFVIQYVIRIMIEDPNTRSQNLRKYLFSEVLTWKIEYCKQDQKTPEKIISS